MLVKFLFDDLEILSCHFSIHLEMKFDLKHLDKIFLNRITLNNSRSNCVQLSDASCPQNSPSIIFLKVLFLDNIDSNIHLKAQDETDANVLPTNGQKTNRSLR